MIKAIGPSPSFSAGWSCTWRNSGSRYASVFPEPVSAIPMKSLPDMIHGMALLREIALPEPVWERES